MANKKIDLSKKLAGFYVRGENGLVDVDGTLDNIRPYVEQYAALQNSGGEEIDTAIETLVARHPGARLNTSYVVDEVARSMSGYNASTATSLKKRVSDHIKSSPRYVSNRGRGETGGFHVVADDQAAE